MALTRKQDEKEFEMSDKKDPSKSPRDTNGPVVKSGPTAGKNRSRNKDGRWRKKRDDTGKSRKKGGCFLTTAACSYKGLPDNCHELEVLRGFRDRYLLSSAEGQRLVSEYYDVAPEIADQITEVEDLDGVWDVVVQCVHDIESGNVELATSRYRQMVEALKAKLLD